MGSNLHNFSEVNAAWQLMGEQLTGLYCFLLFYEDEPLDTEYFYDNYDDKKFSCKLKLMMLLRMMILTLLLPLRRNIVSPSLDILQASDHARSPQSHDDPRRRHVTR